MAFSKNDKDKNESIKRLNSSRSLMVDILPRGKSGPTVSSGVSSERTSEIKPETTDISPAIKYNPDYPIAHPKITEIKGRKENRVFLISLASAAVIIGGGVFLLSTVFSHFSLFIKPHTEVVNLSDIVVGVDTHASRSNPLAKVIAGNLINFAKSIKMDFESTGKKNIEERARGVVKIYNAFSSAPQILVSSTRLLDDKGNLFRLTKTVTIPGALIEEGKIKPSFLEAEVLSKEAGEEFNIGPAVFHIPAFEGTAKYDAFYAKSESDFSGGFKGLATVASDEDIKKATEKTTAVLFNDLRDELPKKIPAGFRLLEGLRETAVEDVQTPTIRARLDKFTIEAKGRARAIIFSDRDLTELFKNFLVEGAPTKEVAVGSVSLTFKDAKLDLSRGMASLVIVGTAKVRDITDGKKIAALVAGQKIGDAEELLKKEQSIASFSYKLFPFWNFKVPRDSQKVSITIEN